MQQALPDICTKHERQAPDFAGYTQISAEILSHIADRYSWIAAPIQRASSYVRNMPFFEFVEEMKSPHEFRECAMQLYYHSATFPKVMGLMLGMTPCPKTT